MTHLYSKNISIPRTPNKQDAQSEKEKLEMWHKSDKREILCLIFGITWEEKEKRKWHIKWIIILAPEYS